jgi:D-tagatose-1,6-bisphosphate aldolase subunit GatZ/KbaZ
VVEQACRQLLERLGARGIPLTLVSQYLPVQYAAIRAGRLENDPRELVLEGIGHVLRQYDGACRPRGPVQHAVLDRGTE